MAGKNTETMEFIIGEVKKNEGRMVPVKAGFFERLFVRKVSSKKLHPNPDDPCEKPPVFPINKLYKERIQPGIPALLHYFSKEGYDIWVYTYKLYSVEYIRAYFHKYSVKVDGIVNGTRHLKEVQSGHKETLPQKLLSRYRISLHIDDEAIVCTLGRQYGYNVYQLDGPDDEWKEKIIECAERIRKREYPSEETEE